MEGNLTTPRGNRTIYLFTRKNVKITELDYIYQSDTDESANPNLVPITQATLDSYKNAPFNTIDVNGNKQVLTYNPELDTFGISSGEYVL